MWAADAATAEDPAEPPKKNWSQDLKESAAKVAVYARREAEQPVRMVAAYKWANPARKLVGDRLCLLYVHEGRPVASCKIYPTGRSIVHTFISFTDLPLVARAEEEVVWSPVEAAPEFTRLTDTKAPRPAASQRRIQMKALAREFSTETGQGEAKRAAAAPELRLLTKPLYRYEVEDRGEDGLVDGAVFCFVVEGGNPQIMMLLESVREGDKMHWQVGFSRRTFAQLKVFRKEAEIWSASYVALRQAQPTSDFYKLDLPLAR